MLMYFLQLYLMNSIITLLWAPFVKNDRNMELNPTILSKNERVCSLSKSQGYNLTLECNKTFWKKVTYCDVNEIFF